MSAVAVMTSTAAAQAAKPPPGGLVVLERSQDEGTHGGEDCTQLADADGVGSELQEGGPAGADERANGVSDLGVRS